VLSAKGCDSFGVVVNMVESEDEAVAVEEKLSLLTQKFLDLTPTFLGRLPRNRKLSSAIRKDRSLLAEHGLGDFTNRLNHIVQNLITENEVSTSFFDRLLTTTSGD
jgi:MinD-like ATPase involved in chromosome partitioning or flagellar assembly